MGAAVETPLGFVDPLRPLLGYQLRRAYIAMYADLTRSLDLLGLKPAEASTLLLIRANPNITQSEIGKMLAIKRANMAPLAAALGQKGLIATKRVDGRSRGLTITPSGDAVCQDIATTIDRHERRFFANVPRADHGRFIKALESMWAV